jgi:hypothetical protein
MRQLYKVIMLSIIVAVFLTGCAASEQVMRSYIQSRSYSEILEDGALPSLKPDYAFPNSHQYQNGCFAFAVKHILEYKFDKTINLYEAEKIINKPRTVLWDVDYITAFLEEYDITLTWYKDVETFFGFLAQGEPLVIQYPYDIGDNTFIGHLVAAYSFDETGVWAADSISGETIHIDYDLVFNKSGTHTRYGFATVWEKK